MYFKNTQSNIFLCVMLFFCAFFLSFYSASSQEFTSTNYKVLDPVMNAGGYGSSTNFSLLGVISQISNGEGTSVSFQDKAGFLYFPFATSPVVSATAGSGQVSLSWTASQGYLGWTASGYNVGRSTVSGGPYTYTSLGNVTSSTESGLSNGTAYYFIVLVKDAFSNIVATSTQVSATPVAAYIPPGGGGGGGGGGYIPPVVGTGVEFSGRAYPSSRVTILKDAQVVASSVAGPDSNFSISITGLSAGNYSFSVYAEDKNGIRGSTLTFPVSVTSGATTKISGIFLAPTIAVDKSEVKRGDNIIIFGQSVPNAQITINVNSESDIFVQKESDTNGVYLLNFDTSILELGGHSTKSKAAISGQISPFSNTAGFNVGTKNVTIETEKCPKKGDLNGDCKVNLVDFSIAAYWYKKELSTAFGQIESARLNNDGKIGLTDFSIMAFYWTG